MHLLQKGSVQEEPQEYRQRRNRWTVEIEIPRKIIVRTKKII